MQWTCNLCHVINWNTHDDLCRYFSIPVARAHVAVGCKCPSGIYNTFGRPFLRIELLPVSNRKWPNVFGFFTMALRREAISIWDVLPLSICESRRQSVPCFQVTRQPLCHLTPRKSCMKRWLRNNMSRVEKQLTGFEVHLQNIGLAWKHTELFTSLSWIYESNNWFCFRLWFGAKNDWAMLVV